HDCRNRARYTLQPLNWRHRLSRDMGVHQFHRIGPREWKSAGDHLVKRHPERIKVAPRIDRAIHSPGLFGGHVGECSGYELGRFGRLALARKARSNPEAHEPSLTRRGINENICRLHVLVDQLLLVQSAECGCGTDCKAQEPRHFHRPWKEAIESLTAWIFEHERHLPTVL